MSEYNFQQSVEDGATVPLFYEKRVPEVLIQNDDFSEEFAEILEDDHIERILGRRGPQGMDDEIDRLPPAIGSHDDIVLRGNLTAAGRFMHSGPEIRPQAAPGHAEDIGFRRPGGQFEIFARPA